MVLTRILLYPFSILYGLITYVRNKLYDWKVISATSFDLPVLSVGNLSVGGTGKTPHIEYLLRILMDKYNVATLSRGYKRKSSGFILAGEDTSSLIIGDEPFQLKTKFKKAHVAVDEKRVRGIQYLLEEINDLDIVLLDDAFQHRRIVPGLSILLTDFNRLYSKDHMLPSGRLREYRCGARRADIIIVTKSPDVLLPETKKRVFNSIQPADRQSLYFSRIHYGDYSQIQGIEYVPDKERKFTSMLLVAGIANPHPLEEYLSGQCTYLEKVYFPDHHSFDESDIDQIIRRYDEMKSENKVIITTEKDMTRFLQPGILNKIRHLPFCYIPIEVKMDNEDATAFENQIRDYVKSN